MKCEQCNSEMIFKINKGIQGWYCPQCNWNLVTSYIEDLNIDETEYSLYIKIKKTSVIDFEKIKIISKIANVNYVHAKKMLESNEICILMAKAPVIKDAISKLKEFHIDYFVNPKFLY